MRRRAFLLQLRISAEAIVMRHYPIGKGFIVRLRADDADGTIFSLPCIAGEGNIIRSGESDQNAFFHSGPLNIRKEPNPNPNPYPNPNPNPNPNPHPSRTVRMVMPATRVASTSEIATEPVSENLALGFGFGFGLG